MLTNYHTHCTFCDGKVSAAEMAEAAAAAGFDILGFSSHAPLPFTTDWTMDPARLGEYVETLRALAVRHTPGMTVLAGLEIDYIDGLCGPADGRFAGAGLDYTIGSAHYVAPGMGFGAGAGPKGTVATGGNIGSEDGRSPTGSIAAGAGVGRAGQTMAMGRFAVDEPEEAFSEHLHELYRDHAEGLVEDYYAALVRCVRAGGFDILGHLDLIRKNNPSQRYFSETSAGYRDAVMQAVYALAGTGIVVEINTGGMARGKTDSPYPALWILKELRNRNIPVCLNADAHHPKHLLANRNDGMALALAAGYERLTIFDRDGRKEIPVG